MIEGIKNIGWFIIGIGGLILLLFISVLILNGSLIVGETILPWLIDISWLVFFVNLLIFLPLALIRKTSTFGCSAMFLSSYVFGLTLWFTGLLFAYYIWGFTGVIIGLIFGGVGVVPVGMLATLLTGEFFGLTVLVILTVLTFGLRIVSLLLSSRYEEQVSYDNVRDVEYEELDE